MVHDISDAEKGAYTEDFNRVFVIVGQLIDGVPVSELDLDEELTGTNGLLRCLTNSIMNYRQPAVREKIIRGQLRAFERSDLDESQRQLLADDGWMPSEDDLRWLAWHEARNAKAH